MSYSSLLGYIERMSPDSLSADQPVSTMRADFLRNNIAHVIDESAQHRINWVGAIDGGAAYTSFSSSTRIWHQSFPHTWLREDRPTNLDVRVAILNDDDAGGSPEITVRVRVVPDSYSVGDLSAPALVDVTEVGIGTSADPAWVVDEQTDFDNDGLPNGFSGAVCFTDQFNIPETDFTSVRIAFMRIEVHIKETTTGTTDIAFGVCGVLVREFC